MYILEIFLSKVHLHLPFCFDFCSCQCQILYFLYYTFMIQQFEWQVINIYQVDARQIYPALSPLEIIFQLSFQQFCIPKRRTTGERYILNLKVWVHGIYRSSMPLYPQFHCTCSQISVTWFCKEMAFAWYDHVHLKQNKSEISR